MSLSVDLLFSIKTPLGFSVRTTKSYWRVITEKHPDIMFHLMDIKKVLSNPDEIRRSRKAYDVFLFYKKTVKYWVVAVAKQKGDVGFLITAYRADNKKEGEVLWHK